MINKINRQIPDTIPGYSSVRPYMGPFAYQPTGSLTGPRIRSQVPSAEKLLKSIDQAIEATGLQDGMTISFHHHFRNGDYVLNRVMEAIARKNIRGLTLAPSSLNDINDAILPFLESGVVVAIETSGARGKLGRYISSGRLSRPAIIRSHGGRARAIECGELKIDVAFIGAPCCDAYGNINGVDGPSACGSLGYAMVDAVYANKVVAITDHLVPHPTFPISIPQTQVDFIVVQDSIGDPAGIASGALRISRNPRELLMAEYASRVIERSGYFRNGYSLQLGSGGASLAAAQFIREKMKSQQITGSFGVGGITAPFAAMLEEGLFSVLFDTQDFDLPSIQSLKNNPRHLEMSASYYANPHSGGPIVNNLDVVILSATEVDVNFNVNVITDSNGIVMGASGGHSDTAAGAKLAIVVAPLLRGRLPMVLDQVNTVVTPGDTVDVIITDHGLAIHPSRTDLIENLKGSGLPIMDIHDLESIALKLAGRPEKISTSREVVAVIEYRDGSIIDVVRKPE